MITLIDMVYNKLFEEKYPGVSGERSIFVSGGGEGG
jgi:hypothetical protein